MYATAVAYKRIIDLIFLIFAPVCGLGGRASGAIRQLAVVSDEEKACATGEVSFCAVIHQQQLPMYCLLCGLMAVWRHVRSMGESTDSRKSAASCISLSVLIMVHV